MKQILTSIIGYTIGVLVLLGYILNIYKLTMCDFDTPLKAETIRIVGVLAPPVGVFAGYMELKDSKDVHH